jgi:hypothetical protein
LAGILVLVRLVYRPGRGGHRPDAGDSDRPLWGGVSEKVFAEINGVRQGMFIQHADAVLRCCCFSTASTQMGSAAIGRAGWSMLPVVSEPFHPDLGVARQIC